MNDPLGQTYAFGFRAVQDLAPSASGVYAVYTARRWLYVGETDDIRQSLFHHLNHPTEHGLALAGPLSFSFDLVPAAERQARQLALLAELTPTFDQR